MSAELALQVVDLEGNPATLPLTLDVQLLFDEDGELQFSQRELFNGSRRRF